MAPHRPLHAYHKFLRAVSFLCQHCGLEKKVNKKTKIDIVKTIDIYIYYAARKKKQAPPLLLLGSAEVVGQQIKCLVTQNAYTLDKNLVRLHCARGLNVINKVVTDTAQLDLALELLMT